MSERFPTKGYFVGRYWLSRRDRSSMWQRTWYDPDAKGRQTRIKTLGTRDLEEAKAELARWYARNAPLHRADPRDVPLTDLIVRHIEKRTERKRSADTIERSLLMWDDAFPGRTVGSLTPGEIEDFGRSILARTYIDWAGQERPYTTETVRRVLSDGRAMLNLARERGELASVPTVSLKAFPKGKGRKRILSAEEAARLILACEQDWLVRFIMIAAGTGARTEAILELSPFQIDRDRRLIHFLPEGREQTKKRRPSVPIADTLWPYIAGATGDRVVGRGGKAFGAAWRVARAAAGLGPDVLPTTFRHTLRFLFWKHDVPETQRHDWFAKAAADPMDDHYGARWDFKGRSYDAGYLTEAVAVVDAWLAEITKAIGRGHHPPADRGKLSVRVSRVSPAQPSQGEAPEKLVLLTGIEPATSSLPRTRSTD